MNELQPSNQDHPACMEKLTWATLQLAEAAAAYAVWQHGGEAPRAYTCRHCGKWHLSRN